MKSLIVLIAGITILIWVCMIAGMTTLAAEDTVDATVTAQIVSVAVTDGVVAYGLLETSATQDTVALTDQQHAGNTGNATEDFNIRGTDSASWTLVSGSPTGDQYRHRFATQAAPVPSDWTALDASSYSTLKDNISTSTSQDFHLEILMSDDTTVIAEQEVDVTVQATTYE